MNRHSSVPDPEFEWGRGGVFRKCETNTLTFCDDSLLIYLYRTLTLWIRDFVGESPFKANSSVTVYNTKHLFSVDNNTTAILTLSSIIRFWIKQSFLYVWVTLLNISFQHESKLKRRLNL